MLCVLRQARDLYKIVCGRTGDCHGFAEKTGKFPSASGIK